MPRYNFGSNSQQENLNRLRQYDAVVHSDQRNQLNLERFDLQQQKQAFEEAYKTSEAERKASEFQSRYELSNQRLGIMEERMRLNNEIRQNDELLKQQAALAKEKATIARQKAGLQFYQGVSQLNPQAPDFQEKFGKLMSSVSSNLVDTEGKIPEDVTKVSDHLWQQHNAWRASQLTQQTAQNKLDAHQNALQDALAGSKPTYGTMQGGTFKPTEAGKEVQDFVQTTYTDPKSGMAVTHVFPRTGFDTMVAASQTRSAANQSVPTPTVTPPAQPSFPAAPQTHIDHLIQNPDLADQFDQKYGPGASQQYLQRRE